MIRRAHDTGPAFLPEDDLTLYLREIGRTPLLDRAAEALLVERAREGDRKAQMALVQANLRFVVSIAMGYRNRGVPVGDLIGEGNLGLLKAVEKFEPSLGVRFISYAVWWIRQAILIALARQPGAVSLPPAWASDRGRIRRAEQTLVQRLGRQPRMEELAAETGYPIKSLLEHRGFSPFRSILAAGEEVPGDAPDAQPTSAPEDAPAMETAWFLLRKHADAALSTLTVREEQVVRRFFGLSRGVPESLEDIGRSLGLSKERIRQIKEMALAKLRGPRRFQEMQRAKEWMEPALAHVSP